MTTVVVTILILLFLVAAPLLINRRIKVKAAKARHPAGRHRRPGAVYDWSRQGL